MPGGNHREWCDAEMLRLIRRKSLAKLRREVEPVEQHTLARFLTHWQGLLTPRRTGHGNLDGCWTRLRACKARRCRRRCWRVRFAGADCGVSPGGLDTLIAAGEVAWAGVEPMGERDGRIALFLADKLPLLGAAQTVGRAVDRARRKAAGGA
jgi:ATP-dependent Lhr-like helicase